MSARTFIIREEIAALVGLNAAIIHERLKFMVEQNLREDRKIVGGRAWVDCTYEEWTQYVPLLSEKQIRTAISRLVEAGLVEKAHHGKHNTDRKLWYTLPAVQQDVDSPDLPSRANGSAPEGKSTSAPEGKSTSAPEGRSYIDTETLEKPSEPIARLSFSQFWSAWPNKKAKVAAERAWKGLSAADREAAHRNAASFFAKWRKDYPTASPLHPATYLNKKRWQDYEDQGAPVTKQEIEQQIQRMLDSHIPAVREAGEKMRMKLLEDAE